MTPEQFARVEACFETVCDLPVEERLGALARCCAGDDEVRRAVEAMLDAEGVSAEGRDLDVLDCPALDPIDVEGLLDQDADLPERIGPYRVIGRLGAGGMGTVYLAVQEEPHRRVAIKVLRGAIFGAQDVSRFRREARILARLRHPYIAQVYEWGTSGDDQVPYLVMELVEGEDLLAFVSRRALTRDERVRLLARVCDAAQHAHTMGVVHRDLKPANVLVSDEATVGDGPLPKVLDFGVAHVTDPDSTLVTRQTTAGQLLGTLAYMCPEQTTGDPRLVDARADVWSLGVMLFELLTGQLPMNLAGRSLAAAVRDLQEGEPDRLGTVDASLRGDLDVIVACALEKEPPRRYPSAAALADDLRRFLRHEPIAARPPSTTYMLRKFARRHRGLVTGALSTFLVLVAGVAVSTGLWLQSRESAQAALLGEERALHTLYRTSLDAAQARGLEDPVGAIEALQQAPEHLRGWEWKFLAASRRAELLTYEHGDEVKPGRHADVAYTRAGRLLLAYRPGAGPERIELVDVGAARPIRTHALDGELVEVQMSADGRRLAALLDQPPRVVVWSTAAGEVLLDRPLEVQAHNLLVSARGACVGAHSFFLRKSDSRSGLVLFDVDAPHTVVEVPGRHAGVALARAADGPSLAGWSAVEVPGCFLLDADGRLNAPDIPSGSGCCFSPAGDRVVFSDVSKTGVPVLTVARSDSLEVVQSIRGFHFEVNAPTFSDRGDLLAAGVGVRETRVWEVETGRLVASFPDRVGDVAFDPSGAFLAGSTPRGAKAWRIGPQGPLVIDAHEGYLYQAVFSPDGRLVASGGADRTVRIFDAPTGEELAVLPLPWPDLYALSFSEDGARLVAGYRFETVVWDVVAGAGSRVWVEAGDQKDPRLGHETLARGFWVHARAGAKSVFWGHTNCLTTSRDGSLFVRATSEGFAVYDRRDGRRLHDPAARSRDNSPVAISDDGALVATARGVDVLLWETLTGRHLATLEGARARVLTLDFNPDGTRLASGGYDNTIRIWDVEHGDELLSIEGHQAYVHSVEFSPDGTQLVSASGDGTVRIWDARPRAERRRQAARDATLRAELAPRVEALMSELGDPRLVSARLLEELGGDADGRAAVRRALLERLPR